MTKSSKKNKQKTIRISASLSIPFSQVKFGGKPPAGAVFTKEFDIPVDTAHYLPGIYDKRLLRKGKLFDLYPNSGLRARKDGSLVMSASGTMGDLSKAYMEALKKDGWILNEEVARYYDLPLSRENNLSRIAFEKKVGKQQDDLTKAMQRRNWVQLPKVKVRLSKSDKALNAAVERLGKKLRSPKKKK